MVDRLSALVAGGALQVPDTGLAQIAISMYLFSNQAGRWHALNLLSEAKHLEHPNAVPVHVYFIPLEPMTRRSGMRMMIVVPSFTKGQ